MDGAAYHQEHQMNAQYTGYDPNVDPSMHMQQPHMQQMQQAHMQLSSAAHGSKVTAEVVDVTSVDALEALHERALAEFGKVHFLVSFAEFVFLPFLIVLATSSTTRAQWGQAQCLHRVTRSIGFSILI